MKTIITIAAALSALALAAPAAAQDRYGGNGDYGYSNGYGGIQSRTGQLRQRLQFGIQRGTISRREAVYLRDGVRQLTRLERQYSRDGLSRYERRDLQGGLGGASKRPDLEDVLFPGGLERRAHGRALLYLGAGDAEVHGVDIPDPFHRR